MLDSTGCESVHSVAVANLCRSCSQDFGSVAAFDFHKRGTHEYTLSEGLRMDPPREDGRRCLTVREMETVKRTDGVPALTVNSRGQWSLTSSIEYGKSRKED